MRKAFVVCGLGFGDEGKGAITDYLARRHGAKLVVRYNGGPQAAHNVVLADGRHHTFAQFGSATFIPGVRTHLSRFMLVNPLNIDAEERHLSEVGVRDAFARLSVDEDCVVVTPFHRAINRLEEWERGDSPHGSCGQGVGVARGMHIAHGNAVLFAGDLPNSVATRDKLNFVQRMARERVAVMAVRYTPMATRELEVIFDESMVSWLVDRYSRISLNIVGPDRLGELAYASPVIVLEGAQGVLLDERHGSAPHNTWTDTTCNNANILLSEIGFTDEIRRVGVLRTYFTRHGAGPFPTEDPWLPPPVPELHNNASGFQGAFRYGHFDAVLGKYAVEVSGVSEIALTHVDALGHMSAPRMRLDGDPWAPGRTEHVPRFTATVEAKLCRPITIKSWGPTAETCADDVECASIAV